MTNYQCMLIFERCKAQLSNLETPIKRVMFIKDELYNKESILTKAGIAIAAKSSIGAAMKYASSGNDSAYIISMLDSYTNGRLLLNDGNQNNKLVRDIISFCENPAGEPAKGE